MKKSLWSRDTFLNVKLLLTVSMLHKTQDINTMVKDIHLVRV